jgi:DNA adenine methylase
MNAPFGWIGGKTKLADWLISQFPPHKIYVEVFGGSLSVLYAKTKPKSRLHGTEVVNDINSDIINLHRIIQKRPESLSNCLNDLLVSRELFYEIKAGRTPRNDIEQAAFTYYLFSQSFASGGNHFRKCMKDRHPKSIYKSFKKYSERLKGVVIENMPFEKLIAEYDTPDTFFYCDPPYYGYERYYTHSACHNSLAETLRGIKGKFLLSYNDCEEIRELYKGFNTNLTKKISYTLSTVANKKNKTVNEIFITNYQNIGLFG